MRNLLIAAVIVAALAIWLSSQYLFGTESGAAADQSSPAAAAAGDDNLTTVRTRESVARPRALRIVVNGRTEAFREVQIRAETEGRVTEVLARRGDRLDRGAVVLRLALDDRSARLAEAEAILRQRQIEFEAADSLKSKGFRSETSLAAARAQLDTARARVERIRLDIDRATLKTPFDGVVRAGHAETGDFLRVGDPAATLVDLDPILIVGHATEREVNALQVGTVGTAETIGGQRVEGIVSFVAPVAAPGTRTYRFEMEAPNPDLGIRAGFTSRIEVETTAARAHLVSPAILSLADDGTIGVKTVTTDNRIVFNPVTILEETAEGVWLGGLPERAVIVTVGQEFVIAGDRVRPVPETAEPPAEAGS